ncbi:MAG: P-loop NTPase [Deltaproteobacteria bacterium]|nr:P-loop NTPase [Deltaproteobacteria bacterium]
MNPGLFANQESEIWAIGGGKGGVGKSFIISSLACSLAAKGRKVILLDADFGGANLHTFLGLGKPSVSLSEFFESQISLTKLTVDTGIPNLELLAGTLRSLAPDSIKHSQKQKFFRHIKNLDADFILIDLGGGTHFNILDTFLLADKMLLVVVPELISIENMYHFLKNALFRKLTSSFTANGMKNELREAWSKRAEHNIANLRELIDYLRGLSNSVEAVINDVLSDFKVHIILNQIRGNQDIKVGHHLVSVCKKYFDLQAQFTGYIEYDSFVSRCINEGKAYMRNQATSNCANEITRLAENLTLGRKIRIR